MKFSPFQGIVLGIFGIAIVAGVVVLATAKSSNPNSQVEITVWGTLPSAVINATLSELQNGNNAIKILYTEKRVESFDHELVEAIASGYSPDVILLPQDLIARYRNKILPIPYSVLPLSDFKNTFIQEGELFLDSAGILAIPYHVDPLVMYWNRDILTGAGISLPPKTWDEFISLSTKLTVKDKNLNILKGTVAMGEFKNITNAQEIIAALLMQTGNPITTYSNGVASSLAPASLSTIGAINFYTDFANPAKPNYSWNRSLYSSIDMFSAGDLAFYFGFASEASKIRAKNPNLNFDVTYFPQPKGANVKTTFGKMQGLAVLRTSRNPDIAIADMQVLTDPYVLQILSSKTGLPPVKRSMLSANPSDPYQSVFYNSALWAKGWIDPNPASSKGIFQNMIESVTSGSSDVGAAINSASASLDAISKGF